jgi:hypothetical protein
MIVGITKILPSRSEVLPAILINKIHLQHSPGPHGLLDLLQQQQGRQANKLSATMSMDCCGCLADCSTSSHVKAWFHTLLTSSWYKKAVPGGTRASSNCMVHPVLLLLLLLFRLLHVPLLVGVLMAQLFNQGNDVCMIMRRG